MGQCCGKESTARQEETDGEPTNRIGVTGKNLKVCFSSQVKEVTVYVTLDRDSQAGNIHVAVSPGWKYTVESGMDSTGRITAVQVNVIPSHSTENRQNAPRSSNDYDNLKFPIQVSSDAD